MTNQFVSRINQLDALELDKEIENLLIKKLQSVEGLQGGLVEDWRPELNSLVRLAVWIFSFSKGNSTFGQKLLNLSYGNLTNSQKLSLISLAVIPKYLEDRLLDPNRILSSRIERNVQKYLEKVQTLVGWLELINLLVFLHRGHQPTIADLLLNISQKNEDPTRSRIIGYSYVSRELLWYALLEFSANFLPILNVQMIKKKFFQLWKRKQKDSNVENVQLAKMNSSTTCPHCSQTPILPKTAGCSHIFCYFCLQSNFTAFPEFHCPQCGILLQKSRLSDYIHHPEP